MFDYYDAALERWFVREGEAVNHPGLKAEACGVSALRV